MPQARKQQDNGENDSVDVPADDPQPKGPADPGEVRDIEFEQVAPKQEDAE